MSQSSVITIPERFDFGTHKWFTETYDKALSANVKEIVLDFSRVNYVDSSALGMMVLLHRKMTAQNCKGTIRNLGGTAKDILDMANFSTLYRYE
ncbi:STAS domain-containing protein [Rhodanobacter aciditrophus]|uniref:STAS domain-containing protein n=1 Tax=Rhodanobacter aciditrophus TaxID=1623218 RepID=A0ABW4AXT1_9GAMM